MYKTTRKLLRTEIEIGYGKLNETYREMFKILYGDDNKIFLNDFFDSIPDEKLLAALERVHRCGDKL